MRIGYARTSTSNQKYSLENQIDKLTKNGCEKIFSEEISSVSAKRPAFDSAIEFARDGDTLVVTTLSRFARSISDLWKHVEELDAKGVSFQILDMNLDTSTPTGKLMLTLLGGVYQFEREILLERQKIGIEKAQREGNGVCQRCCPPISCGVSDLRDADFIFRVEPDGSGGLPVSDFA